MTKQTWNQEQIEAAIVKVVKAARSGFMASPAYIGNVIAELTKPKWTPQEGEVYFHEYDHSYYMCKAEKGFNSDNQRRPLTPDEVPALKVAIKALEYISPRVVEYSKYCETTLAEIKELTNA